MDVSENPQEILALAVDFHFIAVGLTDCSFGRIGTCPIYLYHILKNDA